MATRRIFFKLISQTYLKNEDGNCAFKTKHMWKERPPNPWGVNKGGECDADRLRVLCTIGDFNKALDLTLDDEIMIFNGGFNNELKVDVNVDKNNTKVICYPSSCHTTNSIVHKRPSIFYAKIMCIIPRKIRRILQ